ncbi:Uncharacterised protein [Mycobacteroides abscessus subsp. abscessus]|nr:Uncharacterised protein [Mycobacteroides abscessus subsp. abscessus]
MGSGTAVCVAGSYSRDHRGETPCTCAVATEVRNRRRPASSRSSVPTIRQLSANAPNWSRDSCMAAVSTGVALISRKAL